MINYVDENHPNSEDLCVTDGFLPWAVDYHKTLPEFKKRPITTLVIENFKKAFNLKTSIAFVWVNFSFIFLCGFLIYYLAILYSLSHLSSLMSVVFFYSSFSVLMAYFIPIATYDEPIQYFFILSSLIALRKKIMSLFVVTFTLAIITRESSLILMPAIVLFLIDIDFRKIFQNKIKTILLLIPIFFPVVLYALFLRWFYKINPQIIDETKSVLSDRFLNYQKNFRDIENISRTILSFTSVCLLPIFLVTFHKLTNKSTSCEPKLIFAFWVTFCINTVIILLSVFAEESRVFTLPLLFLFPIYGKIIRSVLNFSPSFIRYIIHPKRIIFLFLIVVLSWVFFDFAYKLTTFKMSDNLYREYNTFSIIMIGLIILYRSYSIKQIKI
ncbi:MAG: hypothetical protein A3K10_08390 [Bacteroidetes bacterium RIFCSPLOWO2_12_FULL_31_6]|nr:MAG: hypothetical protein A3K10_08390 [Bacteroidetes bacterium RIFCSPLOWO2_12_FULL_31_6]